MRPFPADKEEAPAPPSPYDPPDDGVADPWFLPGPPEDAGDPPPRSGLLPLADVGLWAAAEARQVSALAGLAFLAGRLEERLRQAPEGALHRLALTEAAALAARAGERVSAGRLALWLAMGPAGGADGPALAAAGWAARRLASGPAPDAGGWATGLPAFLGRHAPGAQDIADLPGTATLHPFTRAAMAFHLWRMLAGREAAMIEAGVIAARVMAGAGAGMVFLPLAEGNGLTGGGHPADRLARWLDGAEVALRAALARLEQLAQWQARAGQALADLSGRTPPRLIAQLAAWPVLSAPLAQAQTGASRAAIQRNLDLMQQRGLIREVTGQGRFRFWTARL